MIMSKSHYLFLILFIISHDSHAQSPLDYESLCGQADNMLNYVDRASIAPNPCITPVNRMVVEGGYQYQKLYSTGTQNNIPSVELQLGIPGYFELDAFLPDYTNQSVAPKAGFGPTGLGLKHAMWFNKDWLFTLNETITFESGSNAFGSAGTGGSIIGILSYTFNPELSLTGTLGYGAQYEPMSAGGESFTGFSPDLLFAWSNNKVLLFGELYGQTRTGPDLGSGYNINTGVLYVVHRNMTIDLEYNQALHGNLGGWKRYIGVGGSILIA